MLLTVHLQYTCKQYSFVWHRAQAAGYHVCFDTPLLYCTGVKVGSVTVQHVAAADDPLQGAAVTGSLVLGPKVNSNSLNAFPTGVNLFDPANDVANFQSGVSPTPWSLRVPQGAGNSSPGGSTNVDISAMPDFKWEAFWDDLSITMASITLNLDATGLITLEQITSTAVPSPGQGYTIRLQSLAFADTQIEGSVQESIICPPAPCPTSWGTTWELLADVLTITAPSDGWSDNLPRQSTALVKLRVSL